jgi:DNA-binding NarL/FixJ family response regulator
MNYTRVLIVDDHSVVRKGIQMFLATEPSIQVVGEAGDGQGAIRKATDLRPDVILMDLVMPHGDGVEAIAKIKRCVPTAKIIVLTTFKDGARINAALQAGADGYLLKDADGDALLQAIHAVQQGNAPLDPYVARHLVSNVTQHKDADQKLDRAGERSLKLGGPGTEQQSCGPSFKPE